MTLPLGPLAVVSLVALAPLAAAQVEVKEFDSRARIEIGGKLFTELHQGKEGHVYYWPLIGPGGAKMTRSWPQEEPPGEEHDHPHHHSMWFAHGAVNGIDYWSEVATFGRNRKVPPLGRVVLDKVLEAKSGAEQGVLKTAQRWVGPDGSTTLTSVQTVRVHARPDTERLFDFETSLTAQEKELVFGDTKEGAFGIRIAETMRLKREKNTPGEGRIVNSEGLTDGKAWGQRAKWVDMFGPVDGKTLGIAIFDHPSNPRHPTRWHARDYGLFAANPFCEHEMDKSQPAGAGNFTLGAGKTITFRYRVLIHEGEPDKAKLAAAFEKFARE
jgi:hypothetical protein